MNRIRGFFAIRAGEGRLVALVAAMFATIETARGLAEIAADTLFVSRFGADHLPTMYVLLGLVSLIVALGYGGAIGSLPRARFLPGLLAGFAILLGIERVALLRQDALTLPIVWLTAETISIVLLTFVWSVAGMIVTPRQAKRLFPLATSAAIAGSLVGTVLAGPVARLIGVENLLVAVGLLLLLAAGLTRRLVIGFGRPARRQRGASLADELRSGYEYTRRSPLMRLLAISYVLFAVLFFAVSFPYLRALQTAYPNEVDLATTLGLVSAGVTVAAFVVSVAVTNRVFAQFGVAAAALLLPLVYLIGFGVWLVAFTVPTAIAVRFAQQATQRGISNPAWSALFNVVPLERRPQVLAFVDGVPGQIGTSLSGVLLIVAGAVLAPGQVFLIGFVTAALCTWIVLRMRRRYGDELLASLREGLAEQVLEGGPGLSSLGHDPQVIAELRHALAAPEPRTRRLAAELLGRLGDAGSVPHLGGAIEDPEPEVRRAALDAIGTVGTHMGPDGTDTRTGALRDLGDLGDLVDLGGDDAHPRTDEPVTTAVLGATSDPEASVRMAAIHAWIALANTSTGAARDLVIAAPALVHDPDPAVRTELAVALGRDGERATAVEHARRLLAGPAPASRAAGLTVAARLGLEELREDAESAVSDPDSGVRAAALAALTEMAEDDTASDTMLAHLDDEAVVVRHAAARGLASRPRALLGILTTLQTGSSRAQDAALVALGACGDRATDGVRAWALGQIDRASLVRRWSAAVVRLASSPGGSVDDGSVARVAASELDFLVAILSQRERQLEDRLLAAVSVLGAPDATGPIRRSLRSSDADVRGQALEALDALGDRQLAGGLVRLIEADMEVGALEAAGVLGELCADLDPWLRAVALRARAQHLRHGWRDLVGQVAATNDAIARVALGGLLEGRISPQPDDGGTNVTTTDRTLDEIERMLFLRRVSLFEQLAPEDLQRVAYSATERLYPDGEALVHEGEVGDELIVIVVGRVRVVQGEGPEARVVRTYGAGDHIGELAVLTERPRVATVIADGEDVRGLVIEGAALRSILRERPDAAMAMLATLADRMSRQ